MYRLEEKNTQIDDKNKNPSFSSTLLDEIYRSIDEGQRHSNSAEMKFYRETTMRKKQSRAGLGEYYNRNRALEEEDMASENVQRARLLEKWMDKKVSKQVLVTEMPRKLHHIGGDDPDAMFFSSTSSSSDSSTSGREFSSSDTESMYGVRRSRASCFAPRRPKSAKTSVSARFESSEKKALTERKQSALFYEQKGVRMCDNCCHSSITDRIARDEKGLIKSKSRALKICNNLKNLKQPISPGAKLTNFLNSLFTTGNAKKTKSTSTKSTVGGHQDVNSERKAKSLQASTCASSASSSSRSCLSKTESSSREKFCNEVRRTVRFVDEEQGTCLMPVSVPIAWKIGRGPIKKEEEELKFPVMERNRGVEEVSREFLEGYNRHDLKKSNLDEEEEDDDDAASYASSDLFELDHLAIIGNGRLCEELPVYETTHVSTNRAIANGLKM